MNFVPSKDSNLACLSNSDWRKEILNPKLLYERVITAKGGAHADETLSSWSDWFVLCVLCLKYHNRTRINVGHFY